MSVSAVECYLLGLVKYGNQGTKGRSGFRRTIHLILDISAAEQSLEIHHYDLSLCVDQTKAKVLRFPGNFQMQYVLKRQHEKVGKQ